MMTSRYLKLMLPLVILLIVVSVGAIVLGGAFPSQWMLTLDAIREQREIIVIDSAHRLELPVTTVPTIGLGWCCSSDGQYAVFSTSSSRREVMQVYSIRDRHLTEYTLQNGYFMQGQWDANRQAFYFGNATVMYRYDFSNLAIETIFNDDAGFTIYAIVSERGFMIAQLSNGDIYRVSVNNAYEPVLLFAPDDVSALGVPYRLSYSENGGLAFVYGDRVMIIDPETGDIIQSASGFDRVRGLMWSPNGEWVTVVQRSRQVPDGIPYSSYNINVATGTIYNLQETRRGGEHVVFTVSWSPDSAHLAIVLEHFISSRIDRIVISTPDATNIRRVTPSTLLIRPDSLRWMPDRPILLYLDEDVTSRLHMVDISPDRLTPVLLDHNVSAVNHIQGDEIIYERYEQGIRLYRLNIETGAGYYLSSSYAGLYNYVLWGE